MKFFVFADNVKDHRITRFREECDKRDIELKVINIYKAIVCNDRILDEDGRKLNIGKNSIVWALSNLTTGHYIAKIFKQQGLKMWPNAEAVNFSDKFFTNSFFSEIGIPTPKTILINSYHLDSLAKALGGFPCIIKKNVSTVGKFVEIVNSSEEANQFIKDTFEKAQNNILPLNRIRFLLQEFVEESKGVDYRVLCLGGKIIGAMKREASEGFKSNVSLGGKATQVPVDKKMKEYSMKIMKEGNLFYAGIDFMKKGDDYLAIEVNTSAQFKGFEAATGINVAEKIIKELIKKRKN